LVTGLTNGMQCSVSTSPSDPDQRFIIHNQELVCASNACFSPGYCASPCLTDSDCPTQDYSGAAMNCAYAPFAPQCVRQNVNSQGFSNGSSCAGGKAPGDNDSVCQSLNCDSTDHCSVRQAANQPCSRDDECASFLCLAAGTSSTGICAQLCRDDTSCAANEACVGQLLTDPSTHLTDFPSTCESISGISQRNCLGVAGCSNGTCQGLFTSQGSIRGVCANAVGLNLVGASCSTNTDCQSNFCVALSATATTGNCTVPCLDDTDCGCADDNSSRCTLRCLTGNLTQKALSGLCLPPSGNLDFSSCTKNTDCRSGICAEGQCSARCAATAAIGQTCNPAGTRLCVPWAESVDARGTTDVAFDDLYDDVAVCLDTLACSSDTDCVGPQRCVIRPTPDKKLASFCLTPLSDGFSDGALCQFGSNCQSGLCIEGICAATCKIQDTTSYNDTCSTPNRCNPNAPGTWRELFPEAYTTSIAACMKPCSSDSDCAIPETCKPTSPAPNQPRFCSM